MTFEDWWENLCNEGILIPSHPDKASAQLAWNAALEQRWIPCSEKLPEMETPVMVIPVYYPDTVTTAMRIDEGDGWVWAQLGNYSSYISDKDEYEADDDYQYSHWWEIPAPPQILAAATLHPTPSTTTEKAE